MSQNLLRASPSSPPYGNTTATASELWLVGCWQFCSPGSRWWIVPDTRPGRAAPQHRSFSGLLCSSAYERITRPHCCLVPVPDRQGRGYWTVGGLLHATGCATIAAAAAHTRAVGGTGALDGLCPLAVQGGVAFGHGGGAASVFESYRRAETVPGRPVVRGGGGGGGQHGGRRGHRHGVLPCP
jgi:hypothetical protein